MMEAELLIRVLEDAVMMWLEEEAKKEVEALKKEVEAKDAAM